MVIRTMVLISLPLDTIACVHGVLLKEEGYSVTAAYGDDIQKYLVTKEKPYPDMNSNH